MTGRAGASEAPLITAILVTRNRSEVLAACLRSLGAEDRSLIEVIVCDNGSTDGTAEVAREAFSGVVLLRSEDNLGFARAANRAANLARGGTLLFLNDDTVWPGRLLRELLAWQGRLPDAGMIGPRLLNPDGSVQTSVFRFPSPGRALLSIVPGLSGYRGFRYDRALPVDFVSGACFLISREDFLSVGGFDERFFMYGEETDLALRLRDRGKRSWYVPCGDIVHLGSANTRPDESPADGYIRGHLGYCAARMGPVGFRIYLAAKMLGGSIRLGAALLTGRAGRARRHRRLLAGFAKALAAGRGPYLARQEAGCDDKGGEP